MLILIPTLVFWISDLNSIFGQKSSRLSVLPKNWHSISRMLILISALVLWNARLKSRGSWFLFWHKFSETPTLIRVLGKFKSNCLPLPVRWRTEYLEDVVARKPRKAWKQGQKWIIVLNACCSYSFNVAKGKNWSNQRKNVG